MQPKQTLYAVSRMYGASETLLQINNFANPNKIKVGTAIKLPAGTKAVSTSAAPGHPVGPRKQHHRRGGDCCGSKEGTKCWPKDPGADWRYFGRFRWIGTIGAPWPAAWWPPR